MFAFDKSKLKSISSNLVFGEALRSDQRPAVKNVSARADRENQAITLTWSYKETTVSKYLIYRAIENEPMTLYKTISGNEQGFKDANLKMNTKYSFCVKAVFLNGNMSELSKKIEIKY